MEWMHIRFNETQTGIYGHYFISNVASIYSLHLHCSRDIVSSFTQALLPLAIARHLSIHPHMADIASAFRKERCQSALCVHRLYSCTDIIQCELITLKSKSSA